MIRRAEQAIEDNIKVFQQYYSKQDKQDLLAMAALQLAAKSVNRAQSPAPEAAGDPGDADLQARLLRLSELADGYLNT